MTTGRNISHLSVSDRWQPLFETAFFWCAVALSAALVRLIPDGKPDARAAVLLGASAFVIHFVAGVGYPAIALLLGALLWLILIANCFAGTKNGAYPRIFLAMLPLLLVWIFSKERIAPLSSGSFLVQILGISYLFIKGYTLSKDVIKGRQRPPGIIAGLAYFLFFPTYISGPMHLYSEFEAGVRNTDATDARALVHWTARFLLGAVKVKVLVPLLTPMSLLAITAETPLTAARLVAASLWFSAVLLLDFSGYSDIAISVAAAIGIRTPENFRYPYLAPSIREFWQRWHITFTRVLTGYIFVPITRTLQKRWRNRREAIIGAGYFITFIFAGYWHGAASNFLLWGIYHATGLFIYDAYKSRKKPAFSVLAKPAPRFSAGRLVAIAATFLFVSVGWIFFVIPVRWWPRLPLPEGSRLAGPAVVILGALVYAAAVVAFRLAAPRPAKVAA